jgi:UDP-N-acetylglucosamine 2-epimerase (non-hydrolysing)
MKKIISVVGARPNFMKVAPIDRALKQYPDKAKHIIVHTGQHYDVNMSDSFFVDLKLPKPDYFLGVGSGSHAEQTAKIMTEFEKICQSENPDLVIVVGDVNSTVACSLTAVKMGIKVAHVEGGLRSFDRTMPEEINRMATDAICDYCFVTEDSALRNLKNTGFPEENVFFTGNTMIDSQLFAFEEAKKSIKINELGLQPKEFVLVTLHRPSNVDEKEQLEMLLQVLAGLSEHRKVVFPVHPRTRKNIISFGMEEYLNDIKNLLFVEPLSYLDFLALMMKSDFVMTDSGGIQEETTVLNIPCLTLRTTTERPVTIDLGTNILIMPEREKIQQAIDNLLFNERKTGKIPPLWDGKAGERIARIIIDKCLN